MRVLLWHVHGSWTTSFVQGDHTYLLPVLPGRGADGAGRARTWDWPPRAVEVRPEGLADAEVDVVVLQRPHELDLAHRWLGRRPGRDLPAVYVEHNTPKGDVPLTRHPLADRDDIPLVHVTHFNELFWDNGRAPTAVVEHGVVDPGPLYSGELPRIGVVLNDPVRRGRVTGTDLLPDFARVAPVDLFGMRVTALGGMPSSPGITAYEDLPQARMHAELARRRVYAHPLRWTSLGLSLIEAMLLAMPVVALATTEAAEAVPAEAGVVSTDLSVLTAAAGRFLADREAAHAAGQAGRSAALARYGLARFLTDWEGLLKGVIR
jgi:hypothetical protein